MAIFSITGKTLTAVGKVDFGNPKAGPSSVAFSPDGKMALVTRDGDHKISILSINGIKVEDTKRTLTGGIRPYPVQISPKGGVAAVGNQGGDLIGLEHSAGISAGAQQGELSSVLVSVRNSGNETQARGIASSGKNVRST